MTSTAVHGERVFVSDGETFQVSVFDKSGRLESIFRLDRSPASLSPETEARYLREATEAGREISAPFPSSLPAYDKLVVDDMGRVWAHRYAPFQDGPNETDVFGADGVYLGDVVMPVGFTLFDVRGGRALGVAKDELDVERPVALRLKMVGAPDG